MPAAAMPAVARIIGVAGEPGDPGRPGPFPARWRQQRTHRRHEPCVPRFGCLAAARAISRLAPRPARACLCANLWMTCAKARRICAQCGDNGVDSRLAAPLEGPLPAQGLCVGKTLRGARTSQDAAPHLLACLGHGPGAVCAQIAGARRVPARPWRALPGHGQGQPARPAPPAAVPALERRPARAPGEGRGHGRAEKRVVKVVTVTPWPAFPARRPGDPGHPPDPPPQRPEMAHRDQLRDHLAARSPGTGRSARRMDPGPLENREPAALVRDVTFGEDLPAARTGTGPHVMAAIRNLVISILRLAGYASIAAALRRTARDPLRAYRLRTGSK
jgi:hypothetical protein